MLGLLDSEKKTLRICVTVETQYRCVTDRKTDGRDILPRHSPRYGYVLRGNNVRLNCTECSDRFKVRFVVRLQLLSSIHVYCLWMACCGDSSVAHDGGPKGREWISVLGGQPVRPKKCRYDTDTDILISAIYQRYFWYIDPPLIGTTQYSRLRSDSEDAQRNFTNIRTCIIFTNIYAY